MIGPEAVQRLRGAVRASALAPSSLNFKPLAIVTCIGALGGLVIPSLGPLKQPLLVLLFVGLSAKLFDAVLRRSFTFALGLTAFFCALEPAFRTHAPVLPYMSLDYVLLVCGAFTFVLSRPRKGARALPIIAYGFYIAFELAGSVLAESWSGVRAILLPSLLMLLFVSNARRLRLTPSGTTFVFASYIAGAVTLAGFVLRSYLAGNIAWSTESNQAASGGMPPNHISVLLSLAVFACVVLAEDAKRLQRIVILGIATLLGLLMVLTFSRGGTVLVLGSLVIYYVFIRGITRRTLLALVVVGLMGLLISYGTGEITGGKIADRYGQTNTSNRFSIVVEGWGIYLEHPVFGVGTSNFNAAISETKFGVVSGAHNELIRAAAEHGTLGLLTWLIFIGSAFVGAIRQGGVERARRGLRVVIMLFATTSMFYNGLKLTVQPMLVLLALAAFSALDALPKTSLATKGTTPT